MPCLIIMLLVQTSALSASDSEAKQLHQAALEWSQSLRSFSGSYTQESYWLYHPDIEQYPDKPIIMEVTSRFDRQNRFVDVYSPRHGMRHLGAFFLGTFSNLDIYYKEESAEYFTNPTQSSWRYYHSDSVYSPPERVFGHDSDYGMSIFEFLSAGESTVIQRAGVQILIHEHPNGRRKEFIFDSQGRMQRRAWIGRWDKDRLKAVYGGDINELRWPTSSYEYNNYIFVNDIWFPLTVTFISYVKSPAADSLLETHKDKGLDLYSARIEISKSNAFLESLIKTIQYSDESLVVNEAIDESLFHIDIPNEAMIFDPEKGVYVDNSPHKGKSNQTVVLFSAAIVLCFLISFVAAAVWWYRA